MTPEERTAWLELRRTGIGGSDVGPILGLSTYLTPFDIWQQKTNQIPIQEEQALRLWVGQECEEVVARAFMRETGIKVHKRNKMFRDKECPWLLANIDRYAIGKKAGVECKTVENVTILKEQWGPSSAQGLVNDKIPFVYYCQVMHYMRVLRMKRFFVAALIGFGDFRWYVIEFNQELWDKIFNKLQEFWAGYVLRDLPPPASNLSDLAKLYTHAGLEPVEAPANVQEAVEKHIRVKHALKRLTNHKDGLAFQVQSHMGDHNALLRAGDGAVIATWKKSESTQRRTFLTKEPKTHV